MKPAPYNSNHPVPGASLPPGPLNQKEIENMNALELLLTNTEAAVVERVDIPARPERLVLPHESYLRGRVFDWMKSIVGQRGHIYLHQAMALAALKEAKSIVLATATASGKSLVFQADTLRRLIDDPDATVLALYPAKALTSDQMGRWREAFRHVGLDDDTVVEIQGDIPPSERDALLKRARLIVATEDIVQAWLMRMGAIPAAQRFLRSLQLVIIDEAHNLEGVFGSNCAFLFRRLRAARFRALADAGLPATELQFVAASATIADPAGHLEALTGLPFEVIGEEHNGAPCHAKTLLHIEGPEYGAAAEANLTDLVARLSSQIAPNALIAFADGRQVVERVASTIGSDEVEPFRAGFELEDRAAIAKGMHDGTLRAIVSTSALELGIDVPQFNLGLNLGIPMSKKAFQQRVGRIGRSGPGVFAVIAEPSAFAKLGTSLREFYEGTPETSPLYLENPRTDGADDTGLVDVDAPDRDDLVRRPTHDVGDLAIRQVGLGEQARAERAAHVVQVLPLALAGFFIDVFDASLVANAVEAASEAIAGPRLTVAVHQHRLDAGLAMSCAQFSQQLVKLRDTRHGRAPPLALADLEGDLLDRMLADLSPDQRDKVLATQPRQGCKSQAVEHMHAVGLARDTGETCHVFVGPDDRRTLTVPIQRRDFGRHVDPEPAAKASKLQQRAQHSDPDVSRARRSGTTIPPGDDLAGHAWIVEDLKRQVAPLLLDEVQSGAPSAFGARCQCLPFWA